MINIGLKYIYTNYPNDIYMILDSDIYLNKNIKNHIDDFKNNHIFLPSILANFCLRI